jgi:hypothetical protein
MKADQQITSYESVKKNVTKREINQVLEGDKCMNSLDNQEGVKMSINNLV